MIDIKILSKREKKANTWPYGSSGYHGYVPNKAHGSQQAQELQKPASNVVELTAGTTTEKNKKLFDEACRRDKIIKDLFASCTYKEKDRVMFINPKDDLKYGKDPYVTKIISSYAQWPKNEPWPDNDNPMIVTLFVQDKAETLFCTTNLVKPYNSVEAAGRGN